MVSSAARIGWYVNRLRAMDAREIAHRVGEAVKRRAARHRAYSWEMFEAGAGALPALAVDRDLLGLIAAQTRNRWRALAPRADHPGIYHALNRNFAISGMIDWHRDPASELRWPAADYCFDIAYRHERRRGDIKLVWEINRLQFLPALAACAALEGDDALTERVLGLIESWIDANPPFKGVNWASGIELALRTVSILMTIGIVGRERIDARRSARIAACLAAHAYWLARYPSRHSSANNHLIAEAAGLYILGTLAPHLAGPGAAAAARKTLIEETFRQIHGDGVGAEQSPTYTAFTCEWYLLAFMVADRAEAPFPPEVVARIAAAGEHLRWLLDEAGGHPRIGDDDEGRVIGSGSGHEPLYVASIVNVIAAAARRPDLAVPCVRPQLRNAVLGWPDDAAAPWPAGRRVFAEGGYTVWRRRLSGRPSSIVFDHGPLGYLAIAAHGHADALSLTLHVDGHPVLVDAGTYLYHAGGAARDRMRGTAAHNTLCLDGADQSEIAGPFNWRRKARARLVQTDLGDDTTPVVAEHDGYVRDYGLLHRRAVRVDATGLTVEDRLIDASPGGSKPVEAIRIGFLLHPDCAAKAVDGAVEVTRGGEPLLVLSGGDRLVARIEAADYSPAFGVLVPALRIAFEAADAEARTFGIRIDVRPAAMPRSSQDGSAAAAAPPDVGGRGR